MYVLTDSKKYDTLAVSGLGGMEDPVIISHCKDIYS